MNEELPDSFLKHLKPAPLPVALQARLAEPPARVARVDGMPRSWRGRVATLLPIAAVLAIGFALHRPSATLVKPMASDSALTVRQHEKTLLQSKRLQLFEIDGGYWELLQQQWKEESSVATTDSPILIHSSEITQILVCAPVAFD